MRRTTSAGYKTRLEVLLLKQVMTICPHVSGSVIQVESFKVGNKGGHINQFHGFLFYDT